MDAVELQRLLPCLVALSDKAGETVMKVYSQAEFAINCKEVGSPLTCADMASHNLIVEDLHTLTATVPVLSEESKTVPYDARRKWRRFWLVDPLDGTKEFIQRNGEFTVNIALVEDGRPILGVVHAPAINVTYFAAKGVGAFKQVAQTRTSAIAVGEYEPVRLKIVVSRSHPSEELEKLLNRIGPHECVNMGSSLKICLVAEGEAHLYPRLGPTMEWDTAAAHCVVEMAGGAITDLAGQTLRYNKPDLHNPDFIVSGIPGFPWQSYFENENVNPGGIKDAM
ncbi:MAG: 3'(2'),5'-bisphosphate nucleotidase CysQ [Candidatus Binatia bacterium]